MRKILALLLVLLLALPFVPARALVDGTYRAQARGFSETVPITVSLTLKDGVIVAVEASGEGEHLDFARDALQSLPEAMVRRNTVQVDSITGVTYTCQGILDAARLAYAAAAARLPADGVFKGRAKGYAAFGTLEVAVALEAGRITAVSGSAPYDTPGVAGPAMEELARRVMEANTASVDLVAGATLTSRGFLRALEQALGQSGAVSPGALQLLGVSGAFTGEAEGFSNASPIRVTVTLDQGRIADIMVEAAHENPQYAKPALETLSAQALKGGAAELDIVAGATWTSRGFIQALQAALLSASAQAPGASPGR